MKIDAMCKNCAARKQCYPEPSTPPDSQHGREPDKVKPLAQYLFEHDCEYADVRSSREYFQQALDAYQSTENVTIKIERV